MDFVEVLEKEYSRRLVVNSNYSLRAFARDLGIDQSSLSKVLARKRQLTDEVIVRVASNLKLSSSQIKKIINASNITSNHPTYENLDYDRFVAISDWYHDAILELIETHHFKPETKWIAARLGIKEVQAKAAVRRLIKLKFLEVGANGEWIDKSKVNSIHPQDVSLIALRTYQKQILANSIKSIDSVDLSERSHTSNTFSASKENIEDAKKLIAKCRKDVAALLRSSDQPKTEVFHIHIGLFPVTKPQGDHS